LPRSDVIRFDRDEQAYEIKIAEASDRTD
jgi:hypothetical protein